MKKNNTEEIFDDEFREMKYRKKKSRKSKSDHRSDHKHTYQKVIVSGCFGYGWRWAEYCDICGRIKETNKLSDYKDFIRPQSLDNPVISGLDFYDEEELRYKYPGVMIIKR